MLNIVKPKSQPPAVDLKTRARIYNVHKQKKLHPASMTHCQEGCIWNSLSLLDIAPLQGRNTPCQNPFLYAGMCVHMQCHLGHRYWPLFIQDREWSPPSFCRVASQLISTAWKWTFIHLKHCQTKYCVYLFNMGGGRVLFQMWWYCLPVYFFALKNS